MPNPASSQRSGKKDILSVANGVVVQRHKSSILPAQIEVSTYREESFHPLADVYQAGGILYQAGNSHSNFKTT